MVGKSMKRSDILWDLTGPEHEPLTRDERLERLTQYEMQTRVIESEVDYLLAVIESFREGWKQ
jgi:hypothetical protein